jgi:hypothetical protein
LEEKLASIRAARLITSSEMVNMKSRKPARISEISITETLLSLSDNTPPRGIANKPISRNTPTINPAFCSEKPLTSKKNVGSQ